jgi:hypothetical protein
MWMFITARIDERAVRGKNIGGRYGIEGVPDVVFIERLKNNVRVRGQQATVA